MLDFIENQHGRLERPPHCPPAIYQLMLECWSLDDVARPTFAKLYTFFDESDDIPRKDLYQNPGNL